MLTTRLFEHRHGGIDKENPLCAAGESRIEPAVIILAEGVGTYARKVYIHMLPLATLGFVAEVMQNESLDWLREALQLNENSRVLCFSTEGDTDRANYRRIVWDGLHPSF